MIVVSLCISRGHPVVFKYNIKMKWNIYFVKHNNCVWRSIYFILILYLSSIFWKNIVPIILVLDKYCTYLPCSGEILYLSSLFWRNIVSIFLVLEKYCTYLSLFWRNIVPIFLVLKKYSIYLPCSGKVLYISFIVLEKYCIYLPCSGKVLYISFIVLEKYYALKRQNVDTYGVKFISNYMQCIRDFGLWRIWNIFQIEGFWYKWLPQFLCRRIMG